jgi:hypothetical protein
MDGAARSEEEIVGLVGMIKITEDWPKSSSAESSAESPSESPSEKSHSNPADCAVYQLLLTRLHELVEKGVTGGDVRRVLMDDELVRVCVCVCVCAFVYVCVTTLISIVGCPRVPAFHRPSRVPPAALACGGRAVALSCRVHEAREIRRGLGTQGREEAAR